MSNPINIAYASVGNDLFVDTYEATCSAWAAPILICSGYEDRVCVTEDARTLVFLAMAVEEALPVQDNSGYQNLNIALDNTDGKVQEAIELAREAGARIVLTKRRYLESNLTYPAERYRLSVLNRQYANDTATLTCGLFDLLGTGFPRNKLTSTRAPGLIFI
ncbi:hypothetical protein PS934_05030 [Pseudomonas fluorescens]|uniref:DUF1833 family protein n=1 Tax=Pseudomonas fluorescens TaxID=294 RepID=UPI00123FF5AE|nr:DUF1833 family protein [Pseudomonas fluorescens]VVQ20724.1 hypothetical protein PS934_05030 [Pseudomonas fluorescens]